MTFTIKVRTAPGALMTADYECPVHGRFETVVPRDANGDPPAVARCLVPCRVSGISCGGTGPDNGHNTLCRTSSPWRISCPPIHTQFVVSASQGKSAPKPHAKTMDTRLLAEGQKNKFRSQRKKIRDEERHQRVKALLR